MREFYWPSTRNASRWTLTVWKSPLACFGLLKIPLSFMENLMTLTNLVTLTNESCRQTLVALFQVQIIINFIDLTRFVLEFSTSKCVHALSILLKSATITGSQNLIFTKQDSSRQSENIQLVTYSFFYLTEFCGTCWYLPLYSGHTEKFRPQ